MIRTYTELSKLKTFEERFRYLQLHGSVGMDTFGYDRYINQVLYKSSEWKRVRNDILIRDNGCDLGVEGYDIQFKPIIHHMNPLTLDQIMNRDPVIFDPDFLISTTHETHNAIHYGDDSILRTKTIIERKPNDTKLW